MGHLLLGRKGRMIQVFSDTGQVIPATIVEAGPCTVTQVKTVKSDQYNAIQLAFDPVKERSLSKPEIGHCKKAGIGPHRVLRESRLGIEPTQKLGEVITCAIFKPGDLVDVVGTTKGRGTAGVMKRHGFHGRPASHGHMCHRRPGSIGMHSDPGRVFPNKRMAGQYGVERSTVKNLEVISVDEGQHLMLIKGALPGPRGGLVSIQTAKTGVKKVRGVAPVLKDKKTAKTAQKAKK